MMNRKTYKPLPFPLLKGAPMIGIISDTHENIPNILEAVKVFQKHKADLVIHLGDIIAPATIRFFKGLNMKFIKGNCDGDLPNIIKKAQEIHGEYLGEFAVLDIKGKKIAALHGISQPEIDALVKSQQYDYLLRGHNHRKQDEKIGKTRIINPGAHYYQSENTIVLLDVEKDQVEFVEVA